MPAGPSLEGLEMKERAGAEAKANTERERTAREGEVKRKAEQEKHEQAERREQDRREQAASIKLELAKALYEDSKKANSARLLGKVKQRLRDIIQEYPSTRTAEEAKKLLEEIDN